MAQKARAVTPQPQPQQSGEHARARLRRRHLRRVGPRHPGLDAWVGLFRIFGSKSSCEGAALELQEAVGWTGGNMSHLNKSREARGPARAHNDFTNFVRLRRAAHRAQGILYEKEKDGTEATRHYTRAAANANVSWRQRERPAKRGTRRNVLAQQLIGNHGVAAGGDLEKGRRSKEAGGRGFWRRAGGVGAAQAAMPHLKIK